MKTMRIALSTLTLLALSIGSGWAESSMPAMPEMPKPTPEHQWLQQFVGEWQAETEAYMEPGKPPVKSTGTETVSALGDFWTITQVQATMMDKPFTGHLTLGFDPEKQKFVGTWVDSMTGKLWKYEGAVDESGKVLTLETEGSCPMRPGKLTRFKEVIELQDKDHKIYRSFMQADDGQWVNMMTSRAWRKH